jgi:hypothetical protein
MKSTKQHNTNHLSEEEVAIFDEFLDETSLLSTSKAIKNESGAMSLQSLLAALNNARDLADSLQSNSVSNEQMEEINTRLADIEAELTDLKLKISKI